MIEIQETNFDCYITHYLMYPLDSTAQLPYTPADTQTLRCVLEESPEYQTVLEKLADDDVRQFVAEIVLDVEILCQEKRQHLSNKWSAPFAYMLELGGFPGLISGFTIEEIAHMDHLIVAMLNGLEEAKQAVFRKADFETAFSDPFEFWRRYNEAEEELRVTERAVLSELREVLIGIKRTAPEAYRMFIDGIDAMRNQPHVLDDIDIEVSQLIDDRVNNTGLPLHLITEAMVAVLEADINPILTKVLSQRY